MRLNEFFVGPWLMTFSNNLQDLYSAVKIAARLKELGINGEGVDRINKSIENRKSVLGQLLINPGWVNWPRYEIVKQGELKPTKFSSDKVQNKMSPELKRGSTVKVKD